jgi:two-component system chemotaxis response regulator CheY
MRILIAEDDLVSRRFMLKFLSQYGDCDIVVDGLEALEAFLMGMKEENPYDLICLDIMMPKVDGVKVLKSIRDFEMQKGISLENRSKVIMTTALAETQLVKKTFDIGCDAYAGKPIDTVKLVEVLHKIGIIQE